MRKAWGEEGLGCDALAPLPAWAPGGRLRSSGQPPLLLDRPLRDKLLFISSWSRSLSAQTHHLPASIHRQAPTSPVNKLPGAKHVACRLLTAPDARRYTAALNRAESNGELSLPFHTPFFFLPCGNDFWCQRQEAAGFGAPEQIQSLFRCL